MTNTTTLARIINEKETSVIFKPYRSREACVTAMAKMDRTSRVYQFAIANCWKQLKDFFQTEDCTLKDMCKELNVPISSVSEQIKVINTIKPEYYGVYSMSQLVEICRLKNVDFSTYDFTADFPNAMTVKEIRALVKAFNTTVSAADESAADESAADESAADESAADESATVEAATDDSVTNLDVLTIDAGIRELTEIKQAMKQTERVVKRMLIKIEWV